MTPVRRQAILILLGAAVLVLAAIVLARNRSADDELLAVIGVLGAVAILVTALPTERG